MPAKFSIYNSTCMPIVNYSHELCRETERIRSLNGFLVSFGVFTLMYALKKHLLDCQAVVDTPQQQTKCHNGL